MKKNQQKIKGATLIEVVIVVSIVVIVLTAIISGTITSLSVTNYSSKKNQATKLAQEVIELSRKERDQSWSAFLAKANRTWCVAEDGTFTQGSTCPYTIEGVFSRVVQYTQVGNSVEATVTIGWVEGANTRTSKIQTVFTPWK
jgi:type II secretory pathway pseudopilin PulG